MIEFDGAFTLAEFQRDTKRHMATLKRSGKPRVLTVNGRARLVVQDAESYQKLLDQMERSETLAAIRAGLNDVDAGRTYPAREALERQRRRLRSGKR